MLRKARFAFAIWLCVYPLVTSLLLALRASGVALPLPVQTLVLTAVLVPTMVFGLVPFLRRLAEPPPSRER